jgi:putative (di)nucleoside polyphosphate hydrolase
MRFLGEESEIDINTKKPEFLEWKWIDANSLTKNVVDFKIDVYKKVELEVQKFLTS